MSGFTLNDFFVAIIGLVGAIVGGYLSYRGSQDAYNGQQKNEQKSIAKAIDIDLKSIYESTYFNDYYNALKNNEFIERGEVQLKDIKLPGKLYDDKTLLYFVFTHDIAKLDYNLSSKIYVFYNDLFKADKYWDFVFKNTFPNSKLCMDNEVLRDVTLKRYKEMNDLIIKCGDAIPKIREKLREVYYL